MLSFLLLFSLSVDSHAETFFKNKKGLELASYSITKMERCEGLPSVTTKEKVVFIPGVDTHVLIFSEKKIYAFYAGTGECKAVFSASPAASIHFNERLPVLILKKYLLFMMSSTDFEERKKFIYFQMLNLDTFAVTSTKVVTTSISAQRTFFTDTHIVIAREDDGVTFKSKKCLFSCSDDEENTLSGGLVRDFAFAQQKEINENPALLDTNLPEGQWKVLRLDGNKLYLFASQVRTDGLAFPPSVYVVDLKKADLHKYPDGKPRTDGAVRRIWQSDSGVPFHGTPMGHVLSNYVFLSGTFDEGYKVYDIHTGKILSPVKFAYPDAQIPFYTYYGRYPWKWDREIWREGNLMGTVSAAADLQDGQYCGDPSFSLCPSRLILLNRKDDSIATATVRLPDAVQWENFGHNPDSLYGTYLGPKNGNHIVGAFLDSKILVFSRWKEKSIF